MSACISSQGEYSEHEWSPKLICQRCFIYPELPDALRILGSDSDLLWTVARRAIEDELVEWRDSCMFVASRSNGLVIKSRSGEPSDIIRFGPEVGVRIALRALADHLEATS